MDIHAAKDLLTDFFDDHQTLLVEILKSVDGGKLYKSLVKDILSKVAAELQCPFRAVRAVVDLDLPQSKYEVFASTMEVLGQDGVFREAEVEGVKIPNL